MAVKQGKSETATVFIAVVFVLGFVGIVYTFFPISNPLSIIGGHSGNGMFFASLWAMGFVIFIILLYAIRQTLIDLLDILGKELGIDIYEIGYEYKIMLSDGVKTLLGKKPKDSNDTPDIEQEKKHTAE